MASHRAFGMNVHQIDDDTVCRPQFAQQCLHQEIGTPQIAVQEVIPLPGLGFAGQCRIEA